jgi:hypothetical protein
MTVIVFDRLSQGRGNQMKQSHPATPDKTLSSASLQSPSGIPKGLDESTNHHRESESQSQSSSEAHGVHQTSLDSIVKR